MLDDKRCGERKIVVIDAAKMPFIARKISLAWDAGRNFLLTRDANDANRDSRYRKSCRSGFLRQYQNGSCDEYEFASSMEGGAGARTEEMPRRGHREGPVVRDLIDKYGWADTAGLDWTLSVIGGRDADEVVRLYGGDPAQPIGSLTYEDATVPQEDFGRYFHLQIKTHGRHVLGIENNGWTGTLPEIARRASENTGTFFSVYWSPSASGVLEALAGNVTACFDPVLFDPDSRFDVNPAWAEQDDMETGKLRAVSLAYLEQRTGLAFRRAWLAEKLPTYRIPDPDTMLGDVPGARLP